MCVVDQQAPRPSRESQEHIMRWMLFVVVLLLALGSSAAIVIHGASFSPALSIPFLMLGWLMRLLFPSKDRAPGMAPMLIIWLARTISRKASD
jgi:hypothetical protein